MSSECRKEGGTGRRPHARPTGVAPPAKPAALTQDRTLHQDAETAARDGPTPVCPVFLDGPVSVNARYCRTHR
jgi:hypothetical protein